MPLSDGTLAAFMRENSGKAYDCFKAFSYDNGESFTNLFTIPLPGCHRPVSGYLQSDHIMIGYRFMQGAKKTLLIKSSVFFI